MLNHNIVGEVVMWLCSGLWWARIALCECLWEALCMFAKLMGHCWNINNLRSGPKQLSLNPILTSWQKGAYNGFNNQWSASLLCRQFSNDLTWRGWLSRNIKIVVEENRRGDNKASIADRFKWPFEPIFCGVYHKI